MSLQPSSAAFQSSETPKEERKQESHCIQADRATTAEIIIVEEQ